VELALRDLLDPKVQEQEKFSCSSTTWGFKIMPENVRKVLAKIGAHGIDPTTVLEESDRAQRSWLSAQLHHSLTTAAGRLGSQWEGKSPRQRARWWAAIASKELRRLVRIPPRLQQDLIMPAKRRRTKVAGRARTRSRDPGRGVRLRWTFSAPPTTIRPVEPQTSGLGTKRRRRMEMREGYFARKLTNMLRERARRRLDSEEVWEALLSFSGESGREEEEKGRTTWAETRDREVPTLTGRESEDLMLGVRAWLRKARTR